MPNSKPTVVVTGIAGNLGLRLLPELGEFSVIGIDLRSPATSVPLRFEEMDFGKEESCRQLYFLLRETRPVAVVHLAFVIDPVRTGVLDVDRMWHINVAGTARVMEAITEANREDVVVQKFVYPSSVSAYGPSLPGPVTEEFPLGAHTLPYAIHKKECDEVVQQRAPSLRGCSAYLLRPHIFAGATVQNYLVGAFRGTPNGKGRWADKLRAEGTRLPCMLPWGKRYVENRIQFIHVDDMARLLAYILHKTDPETQRLTVLNVAGRGAPMTFAQCIAVARNRLIRSPGRRALRWALELLWKLQISAIPPQAEPYMTGEYIMNTDRLQKFLGPDYERVIRHTIAEAFEDCFAQSAPEKMEQSTVRVGQ